MRADFSLRSLARDLVREQGTRPVTALARELDRRIPEGPAARAAYLQALEELLRDVVREERESPAPAVGRVIESRDDTTERCHLTDMPVYSCSHCTGRHGYEAEPLDEFSIGRELRERIEAGTSREQAVDQVLAMMPEALGVLGDAVRSTLLRRATAIERAVTRDIERAALASGGRVTSLERAAAAVRLSDVEFKLPDGQPVAWGRATRGQHQARIAWSRAMAARHAGDASIHEKAVDLLDGYGARYLDEIPGWEGEMGQLPAAVEGAAG